MYIAMKTFNIYINCFGIKVMIHFDIELID